MFGILPYHLCCLNLSGYSFIELFDLRMIIFCFKLEFKLLLLGISVVSMAVDKIIILLLDLLVVGFLLLFLLILFILPIVLLVAPMGFLAEDFFLVIVQILITFIRSLNITQNRWLWRSKSCRLV